MRSLTSWSAGSNSWKSSWALHQQTLHSSIHEVPLTTLGVPHGCKCPAICSFESCTKRHQKLTLVWYRCFSSIMSNECGSFPFLLVVCLENSLFLSKGLWGEKAFIHCSHALFQAICSTRTCSSRAILRISYSRLSLLIPYRLIYQKKFYIICHLTLTLLGIQK